MVRLVFASLHEAPKPVRERHVVISDLSGTPLVFGWRSEADYWLSVPEVGDFRFRPGSDVVTAYPEQRASPEDVRDAYEGSVLPIAAQVVLGRQSIHASAVAGRDGRVVAFCGFSEAGKTTIAAGLTRRGCALWADDALAFEVRSKRLTALRLPFQPNLREQSAAYFDSSTEDAKAHAHGHPQGWTEAPLTAFCVLERLDETPESYLIERLSPSEAFAALLAQSLRFKPQAREEKRRMMRDYMEAIAQLPVFRVRYRSGFETFGPLIDEIERIVLGGVAEAR
jgi:hypothetical protein